MVAVSQDLLDILTFHRSTTSGLLIYAIVSVVLAVLGAALRLLPALVRRAVVGAFAAVVAMGLLQRIVPTAMSELGAEFEVALRPHRGRAHADRGDHHLAIAAAAIVGVDRYRQRERTKPSVEVKEETRGDDPVFGSRSKPPRPVGCRGRPGDPCGAAGVRRIHRLRRPGLRGDRSAPGAGPQHHRGQRGAAPPGVRRVLHGRGLRHGAVDGGLPGDRAGARAAGAAVQRALLGGGAHRHGAGGVGRRVDRGPDRPSAGRLPRDRHAGVRVDGL